MMKKLTSWVLPAVSMLLPLMVAAQDRSPVVGGAAADTSKLPGTDVKTVSDVFTVLCQLLGWLFVLFIILAVVFVILAAFKYLTAQGDAEKVGSANHMLIYAVVAVVVAVLARAVPVIIQNFFVSGVANFVC